MKSIIEKQNHVVQELTKHEDWMERYKRIIQMGKELPEMPAENKIDQNKVKGCQSQVWLHAYLDGDRIVYQADSDALIVRGLAAILMSVFSGSTPDEIIAANTDFLAQIGLTSHLSQSRSNGLVSMVKQFKNYALAFKVMLERGRG